MSEKKCETYRQKRDFGGNHPSSGLNLKRRASGHGGVNSHGRTGVTRSWTSDNKGGKCTPNHNKKRPSFPKFRDSYQKYGAARNKRSQRNYLDRSDHQLAHQQNKTAHQTVSTTTKPTIVTDLTTENATLSSSTSGTIGKTTLKELRKEDDLRLRYPMEIVENQAPKIKIEKSERNQIKPQPKPQLQHKCSSSSSSTSDEEIKRDKKKQVEALKPAAQKRNKHIADDKEKKVKIGVEHKSKKSFQSGPSESSVAINESVKNEKKDKETRTEKKLNSDEDVVCLGKAENKFSLDDEELESPAKSSSAKKTTVSCILCDKKGHTPFECQMICKNCLKPYHSLKNCPQPANISVMMQYFMEFLMDQMSKYNPQIAYPFDHRIRTYGTRFENTFAANETYGKRKLSEMAAKKQKSVTKKSTKKRRNIKSDEKDIECNKCSSSSQPESETSYETDSDKYKRKNSKANPEQFLSSFPGQITIPPFCASPGFGVHQANAAAAFNPILPMLNQLMQNGYTAHGAFNFRQ